MPSIWILIPCLALGAYLAAWGQKPWWKTPEDHLLMFLGFFLGGTIAWAIMDPWFALALLLVVPLIVLRRRRAR